MHINARVFAHTYVYLFMKTRINICQEECIPNTHSYKQIHQHLLKHKHTDTHHSLHWHTSSILFILKTEIWVETHISTLRYHQTELIHRSMVSPCTKMFFFFFIEERNRGIGSFWNIQILCKGVYGDPLELEELGGRYQIFADKAKDKIGNGKCIG